MKKVVPLIILIVALCFVLNKYKDRVDLWLIKGHWTMIFNPSSWEDYKLTYQEEGLMRHYSGDYNEALNLFDTAVMQARQQDDAELEALILKNKADTYRAMGNVNESIAHLRTALSISEDLFLTYKLKNDRGKIWRLRGRIDSTILELSNDYYSIRNYDSSLFFCNRILGIKDSVVPFRTYINACEIKLATLIKLNRADEINEDIKRISNKINQEEYKDFQELFEFHSLMYSFYQAKGQNVKSRLAYDSAKIFYDSSLKHIYNPENLVSVHETMHDLYYQNGEYENMFVVHTKIIESLKENINNVQFRRDIDNRKGMQLDKNRLAISTTYVVITIILFLIILIYQYKVQTKNNIIKSRNDQLQTLMKEIHHRVKNNLQVIASLLDLQSHTLSDGHASEAIKAGRNRVLSMALIHQNLYGEHSLQGINVKEYINKLCEGLITAYNIKPGRIKINTVVDELKLDVETVTPHGLIINEGVSNSLKHAFKKDQDGELFIELKEVNDLLVLSIKDNGKGFPEDILSTETTSFGMKLIKTFARQLKAEVQVYNNGGACLVMGISKYKRA